MNDPTIISLREHPDYDLDPYWIDENLRVAREQLDRIPPHYANAVTTVPEIREWVRQLVQGAAAAAGPVGVPRITSGPSLLVLGPVGTGKTYEAYGTIRALAASGVRTGWRVATAADIYGALRPRHGVDSEAEFERCARVGVLVLDDLGAAKTSEWVEEINYRLVNWRYERELPTLITSNLPPKDLGAGLGERVASRLAEMTSRVVLDGPDRRRARAA
ncbi:ATP-binding protein [Prauserella flavalba]|uniref:ATP-binding protein n=1 Tax=Prauserella flavalba TaxID=1477506 RepID=UPI0036EED788